MDTITPSAISEQFNGKALLDALVAYRRGDFSTRLPDHWTGVAGKIADNFNAIVDSTSSTVGEFEIDNCRRSCMAKYCQ